jgi:O-antigen/teichoic acid export membrane protein
VAVAPGYLAPGLASLVSVPLLFASLGAGGYGTWALIYAIGQGLPVLATSWVEATTIRFGHRRSYRLGPIAALGSIAGASIAGGILAALLIPGATVGIVAAGALLTGSVSAYLVTVARLQSALRFDLMSGIAIGRTLLGATAAVAIAYVTGDPALSISGLALGFLVVTVAVEVQRFWSAPQQVPLDAVPEPWPDPISAPSAESGRYGAASFALAVGLYVLSVGDRFVLSAFRPLDEVGVYTATYTIADLLFRFAPAIVLVPLRARLFRSWDSGAAEERRSEVATIAVLMLWAMAWGAVGLVIAASAIGISALDPMLAGPIAVGLVGLVVATALSLVYSAEGRQVRNAAHTGAAAIANLGSNWLLIPVAGSVGAAVTTAATYGLLVALHAVGWRSRLVIDRRLIVVALSGVVALVAVTLTPWWAPPWQPVALAIAALAAGSGPAYSRARSLMAGASPAGAAGG